jgi:hypothetical protein
MYVYTILGSGLFGAMCLVAPDLAITMFRSPEQEPIVMGVASSVYVAFAALSVLGLRAPLKFAPILALQLCYKVIWLLFIALPHAVRGDLPLHGWVFVGIFASYVVGDLVAIPFRYVFAASAEPPTQPAET